MTQRALRMYVVFAASLIIVGMLTQSFAHTKMPGNPPVSYWPYGVGLVWGGIGWIAACRWQAFRVWSGAPIWIGAVLATISSLALSRAIANGQGGYSGLMGLIPILLWGGCFADQHKSKSIQLDEASDPLTFQIICLWYLLSLDSMSFPSSLYGLAFLTITSWRSPLRKSMVKALVLCAGFTAFVVAMSAYRREKLMLWMGYGSLPHEYLRERIVASLNSPGIDPFILGFANEDFLLTSLIEWQRAYFPGLAVGAVAIGLPAWAIYSLLQDKRSTWQRAFGLGLAGCLFPIACAGFFSNLGIAITHIHALPMFAPDVPCLIFGVLLLGALIAARSEGKE